MPIPSSMVADYAPNKTPAELRDIARRLREVAATVEEAADRMERSKIRSLKLLHGRGVMSALTSTLEPFASIAKRRVEEAGG
jgi:hypothetical protein